MEISYSDLIEEYIFFNYVSKNVDSKNTPKVSITQFVD